MALEHELHNASFSFDDGPFGRDIVFHDPFVGTELAQDRVPLSIVAQENLYAGINRLAAYGHENGHRVMLAGASHSEEAQSEFRELQRLIRAHDVTFIEGIGHTEETRDLLQEVALAGRSDLPDHLAEQLGNFKLLQLAAIHNSHKPAYFADIPSDGTAYETALMDWGHLVQTLVEQARDLSGEERRGLFRAALISIAASTILREWQMLGAMGNSLQDAQQKGYEVRNSLFLIGTEHMHTLPRKLGMLGVASASIELTMYQQGATNSIECEEFDFTTAVRDYRAPITA